MFVPVNPENERIRAQAVLRSFTEYENAVDLFVPKHRQGQTAEPVTNVRHNNGRSIRKAITRISRALVSGLTQSQGEASPTGGRISPTNPCSSI